MMVKTLHEIYTTLDIIVKALEEEDTITARNKTLELRDFMQNAHIIPILTTEQ